MGKKRKATVAILHNLVGEDEFVALRQALQTGSAKLHQSMVGEFDQEAIGDEIATVLEEIHAVADALKRQGYRAKVINIEDSFEKLLAALTEPRPDVVFNLVEWFNDTPWQEDRVAALYDLLQIPYTGSPPATLATCQRKVLTKQILQVNGIPTPPFMVVEKEPIPRLNGITYPVIVKPSREDASEGVSEDSVVEDREGLVRRVQAILRDFEQPALVEEFIQGRELGVSVIGGRSPRALPIEEMDFRDLPKKYRGIISYESKWDPLHEVYHKAELVCPARLPKRVAHRAQEIALDAYHLLGCRDYARVDMRLDRRKRLFVLEVNPNPDLAESVGFMASAQAAGISFGKALARIVEAALRRDPKKR